MKTQSSQQKSNWEKQEIYRQILDTAEMLLVILDEQGKVNFINQKASKLLECSQNAALEKDWFSHFIPSKSHPEKLREFYTIILKNKSDIATYKEYYLISKTGKQRLIKWNIKLIFNSNQEIIGIVNSGEDITTQRKLVKELHRSEEKYRYLVNDSPVGIFQTNSVGEFLYVNTQMPKILEYENQQQMLESNVQKHYPDVLVRKNLLEILKQDESINNIEVEMLTCLKKSRNVIISAEIKEGIITGTMLDITDLVKTRKKLNERENQVRELFDRGADPMFLVDSEGKFADVNPAACRELGYTRTELLGEDLQFVDHDFMTRINEKWFWENLPMNESITFEAIHHRKDGSTLPVEVKASCYEINNKVYLYALARNLTERKQREKLIQENEAKYRTLLDNLPQKIFFKDLNLNFVAVNKNFAQELNLTPNEMIGCNDYYFFESEKARKYQREDRKVLEEGRAQEYEEVFISQGKKIINQVIKTPVYNDEDELIGLLGIFWNITERKEYEEKIRRSEEKFKRIFNSIQEGYLMMDMEGKITSVNPATLQILEYTDSCELLHFPIGEVVLENPDDFPKVKKALIAENELVNFELNFVTQSGDKLVADCSLHLLLDDNSQPAGIEGTFRDVTERRWVEEAFKSSLEMNKIMSDLTLEETISHGLEEAVRLTRSHIGFFHFVNEKKGTISLTMWSEETKKFCTVPDKMDHYPIDVAGIWVDCIRQKKPIIHNDYGKAKNKKGLPDGHFPLIREITTPIIENGEVVAVIGVGNKSQYYDEFDAKQLSFAAENMWSIIRRKQTANDLKIAKEQAIRANKSKSIFLANMSHEIRTPMNSVIGFADLLTSHIDDPLQKNYLESIKSSGRTLLRLINDILDLSKIEAGRMVIQPEPTNIRNLFNELQNVFLLLANQKSITLTFEISEETPAYIHIDEIRLRQVMLNLIGNAVKFTDDGFVKVSCNYNQKGTLIISVEDSGIGIPESSQEEIFQSFRQQDEQDIRRYGGTGLGLAISKRLIELMHGTISLKSIPAEGSTFTIEFKKLKPLQNYSPKKIFNFSNIIYDPATILVVDDIESNRNLIKGHLHRTLLTVIEAENGEEAIQQALKHSPNLILMDIRMPVMDGYDATTFILKEPALKNIPVIALTASVNIANEDKKKQKLFKGVLYKPLTISDLHQELTRHLKYSRKKTISKSPKKPKNNSGTNSVQLEKLVKEVKQKIIPQWNEVLNASNINAYETFSNNLNKVASKYHIEELEEFASQLSTYAKGFDIENVQRLLKELPNLIDNLEAKVKS